MTDKEIIDEVNETARLRFNAKHVLPQDKLPRFFRCHLSHIRMVRVEWGRAVEDFRRDHDVDPVAALARIEAELRNPVNAPELHVERR